MNLSELDFDLPDALIARHPATPRDASRLLVLRGNENPVHDRFDRLPLYLRAEDLLVVNDSRVLPARLRGRMGDASVELLLLSREPEQGTEPHEIWTALGRPAKRLRFGARIALEGCEAEVLESTPGTYRLRFAPSGGRFTEWLERHGEVPLPPYLKRPAAESDRRDYQTVYAEKPGSVAAPTAGLHFTHELFGALAEAGVGVTPVTLHVGYGTFAPIRSESLDGHIMHAERYEIPEATLERIASARSRGGRVIAVGTTSARVLETHALGGGTRGETRLFIRPGHRFRAIDGLVTNFHLPRSSLLALVAALLGTERMLAAYREAVARGYRFYSYGDAMAILPG